MSPFLPLLDSYDPELLQILSRLGPLLLSAADLPSTTLPPNCSYHLLFDHHDSVNVDDIVSALDHGAEQAVVPLQWAQELVGVFPRSRLGLLLDAANVSAVTGKVRDGVSSVILKTATVDLDLISSISQFFQKCKLYVLSTSTSPPPISVFRSHVAAVVLPTSQFTISSSTAAQINVADAFIAPLVSDRPDGLIPTVVSSWAQGGKTLGLVYSSEESIRESIITGKGVYQSRKHGLWRKGETSGATQDLVSIRMDCDSDCLEYSVIQHGAGFCHLDRWSCFGGLSGLAALEDTLKARLQSAPVGSYTRRLFDDPALLKSKIMEEADELCTAQTKDTLAFEAADLLYFALVRCVAAGVGISDIEQSLDKKARKITRRPGNAKQAWLQSPTSSDAQSSKPNKSIDASAVIRLRTVNLDRITPENRLQLLKRPVLKSEEMIAKVKPIVDAVRLRGDAALLEYTAKFDKAQLDSPVLRPPYDEQLMVLPDDVREAIDVAYSNIYKFHKAQVQHPPLIVETMPGVVCTRFARPIARVGLYVPGGTAILPSTALMLGIPAQVAGCKEVVLATPPRPDGSISPEVMYVAKLVEASAILKAGGGQAVAALAYGTESVPKVDKIFGPGNQWVTAAKMMVQNDTDALVSIDMPAGPSEVLVIADKTAEPGFVAADLLSQAEHGVDSQVVLVAVDLAEEQLRSIEDEVDKQAKALSRVDILRESVGKSLIVKVSSMEEGVAFSNDYAPEHLILHVENAPSFVPQINNAGSVFVGPFTPESCGDYASGTNHTLPTNGYARQFSGVNTQSFQKHITSQEISIEGLKVLGPTVATLADCEGLQAHANAVRIRLQQIAST